MTQRRATGEVGKYIISAVILGAAVLGMFGLIASREKTESQDPDVLVPVVRTFPAELFEGQLDLEVSGLVVPYREINLSAQVAGRVARKTDACQAGTYVEFDPDSELERFDRDRPTGLSAGDRSTQIRVGAGRRFSP